VVPILRINMHKLAIFDHIILSRGFCAVLTGSDADYAVVDGKSAFRSLAQPNGPCGQERVRCENRALTRRDSSI
jgi:hypothetical protein